MRTLQLERNVCARADVVIICFDIDRRRVGIRAAGRPICSWDSAPELCSERRFLIVLPEAVHAALGRGWDARAELTLVVIGFVLFHVADRFAEIHGCPDCESEVDIRRHVERLSAVGLILHSTIDGASIAAATLVSWRTGLIVAIGIIAHDIRGSESH
jgi:zinc transporter ZupT